MTHSLDNHGMRFGFGGVMPADYLLSTQQQVRSFPVVYYPSFTPTVPSTVRKCYNSNRSLLLRVAGKLIELPPRNELLKGCLVF
jgi:hypothetical protein